ncbi:MAG: glycosyltransferase, partial [Defluviitaleaceae bacterium]|nr:glycosyltransferase [Defluviitaleaceae bacterium]
ALLLKKNYNNIPCVTRTHGYDLYKFRNKLGYQPYKTWMDKKINKVFFISQHGYNYYLNEFAKSETKKYCLSRLGIINNYFAELDKQEKNNNTLVLCSCSYIVPVKRLHHIIKALGQINEYKIHWIHIGDGPEKNSIESLADEILGNKNNITYEFKGFMNNDHVMQFYNANYFDCFISASESEGLPVSMMEAISFQIPVIATDVGGVSELVSKETGILLSSEGNISEISKAIVDFYNLSSDNKNSMRKAARLFWESNFNAEVNHAKFANELIKLANNNNQSK